MLRKYLVVLGYSGKLHRCWTTLVVFFIKMFHVRGRHQMMNSSFYVCDHANSILFSSFPHCLGWFASLTALALKRRSLEWITGLHVCSVHFEVALPFSFFCVLCVHLVHLDLNVGFGSLFSNLAFAAEPQQKPFGECDVMIKGSGCPLCHCVSFEMQTLQWIFLWAMNV